jgi:hypothetical protein
MQPSFTALSDSFPAQKNLGIKVAFCQVVNYAIFQAVERVAASWEEHE